MLNRYRLMALVIAVAAAAAPANAQDKKPRSGYLGFRFEETVDTRNSRNDRIVVQEVSKDSPAEKAGIKVGDQIIRINGMVATNGKFSALARTLVEGDTVRLRVQRDARERDVTVIAAARPAGLFAFREITIAPDSVRRLMLGYLDSARMHLDSLRLPHIRMIPGDSSFDIRIMRGGKLMPDSLFVRRDSSLMRVFRSRPGEGMGVLPDEYIRIEGDLGPGTVFRHMELGSRSIAGAEFTELDPGMREYFGTDRGLLALRVAPETPADRAGLQPGDVVVKAKDRVVGTVSDLRAVIGANPEGVKLDILRKGQSRSVEIKTRR